MTEMDAHWAWSRVEAIADGSLPAAEERRMRAAMAADPKLAGAVAKAAALRATLRRLAPVPVPAGLRPRLLRIPTGGRGAAPRGFPPPAWAALGAALTVTAAVGLWVLRDPPVPDTTGEAAAAAAAAEVQVAMAYLQRSSAIAGAHVTDALRNGLAAALETSAQAIRNDERPEAEGERP